MNQVTTVAKYFKIFYSKDVNKKKRTFSQGVLSWENKKIKLFNSDGQMLIQINEKSQPQIDEEYVIGYKFAVLIDSEVSKEDFASGRIFISIVDGTASSNPVPVVSNKSTSNALGKNKPKQKKLNTKVQQQDSMNTKKNLVKQSTQLKNGLVIQNILFTKLRQHQIEGVQFMYDCLLGFKSQSISGCILADFMGLGKTLQTITLIYSLLKMKKISKCIVISPLTLVYVWQKECKKWLDNKLSPLIALGDGEEVKNVCKQFASNQYRMLVLSYQGFYRFIDILDRKCDLIVFDEGHRLKNKNSKVYKKILNFSCRKRVLLTGTPLQNNLQELYTCISVVNPSLFSSQQLFNNVFQKPILNGMAKKATQLERKIAIQRTLQLANKIKQFSLRRKADTLQKYLPIKRQYFVLFKLTSLQKLWYERLLKRKQSVSDVLGFLNLFRKLFTHPQILKNDRLDKNDCSQFLQDSLEQVSYKMNFILDVCKNSVQKGEKVIVVSYFTSTLDFVGKMLRDNEISCIKLDGKVDGKDREVVVSSFQREKPVLLLSGKAGGTGLTLVSARTMIIIEPDWNPSNDSQVIGRVWRQGQTSEVNIYRLLVISSFEQRIIQRQQLKNTLSQKLIDESKSINGGYDFMDMRKLFVQSSQKSLIFKQSDNVLEQVYSESGLEWQGVVMAVCKQSHQSDEAQNEENGDQKGMKVQTGNENDNEFADGMTLLDGLIQQDQENDQTNESQHKETLQNQIQLIQDHLKDQKQQQILQLKPEIIQKNEDKIEEKIQQKVEEKPQYSTLGQEQESNKSSQSINNILPKIKKLKKKKATQNQIILQTQFESKYDQLNSKENKKIKKKVKKYQIVELQSYRKVSSKNKQSLNNQQLAKEQQIPTNELFPENKSIKAFLSQDEQQKTASQKKIQTNKARKVKQKKGKNDNLLTQYEQKQISKNNQIYQQYQEKNTTSKSNKYHKEREQNNNDTTPKILPVDMKQKKSRSLSVKLRNKSEQTLNKQLGGQKRGKSKKNNSLVLNKIKFNKKGNKKEE